MREVYTVRKYAGKKQILGFDIIIEEDKKRVTIHGLAGNIPNRNA